MHDTALLLVDAQVNMFEPGTAVHGGDALLGRLVDLLAAARVAGAPVFFVRNCGGQGDPDEPHTPGWAIHPMLTPDSGDTVIDKSTPDAFVGTPLHRELAARHVSRLVVAGLQTEFCIEATCRAAARRYDVTLVEDGHGTFDTRELSANEIVDRLHRDLRPLVRLRRVGDVRFDAMPVEKA